MSRIIAKVLVSNPSELDFVRLNAMELLPIVDEFLITEANRDNFGNPHEAMCENFKDYFPLNSGKVKYIYMDISSDSKKTKNNSELLHHNEQIMRNHFVNYIKLQPEDIVISSDADEIIFRNRAKKFIRKLERQWPRRDGYVLKLHQFVYKSNLCWVDCNFRGPVITRASVFLDDEKPQWRYQGSPTLFKSGSHFSWVMSIESMVDKIRSTSHAIEYAKFANQSVLESAVTRRIWIFDQSRSFKTKEIKNFRNYRYPRSLRCEHKMFEFTKILA